MVATDGVIVKAGNNVSSDLTAYTVQDGDGLEGGTGGCLNRAGVEGAFSRRCAAIPGVMDLCTCRSGDGYTGTGVRVIDRSDDRCLYRAGLGTALPATGLAVIAAALVGGRATARTALILGTAVIFTSGLLGTVCSPLALCKHDTGLFAGGAVHKVEAEEHLGGSCAQGAVLGHILCSNVNHCIAGFLNELDGHGLVVGAGHTVGLAFGSLNDQEDATIVVEVLVQLEGEHVAVAHDGGLGRSFHTHQLRRVHQGGVAAGDHPVVEAGEKVGTGDLGPESRLQRLPAGWRL